MIAVSAAKNRRVRNKYHTNTKLQVKLGILPEKVKKLIPKSTLYGFRQYDYSGMFRFAEQNDCDLMLEFSKKIINNRIIRKALQMYKAYNRLKTTILDIFTQIKNIKPHMKKFKENIVAAINRVKNTIGLHNACRFFRISVSRFYSWLHQVNHPCPASVLKKCRHRWSNQITQQEEKTMVKYLNEGSLLIAVGS